MGAAFKESSQQNSIWAFYARLDPIMQLFANLCHYMKDSFAIQE